MNKVLFVWKCTIKLEKVADIYIGDDVDRLG